MKIRTQAFWAAIPAKVLKDYIWKANLSTTLNTMENYICINSLYKTLSVIHRNKSNDPQESRDKQELHSMENPQTVTCTTIFIKSSWRHHWVHLLSCECKTSSRDCSSLGRSSVNGGGWYELRTEEDRQDRLENCSDCLSGQYRYMLGIFREEAEERPETRKLVKQLESL